MERQLISEFSINAAHSNVGSVGNRHSHTFTVTLKSEFMEPQKEKTVLQAVKNFLDGFDGKYLNELEYFEGSYPSVEEMGDRFFESLKEIYDGNGVRLFEVGVSDSPLVTYMVSETIMLPNLNDNISRKNYEIIMKFLERFGEADEHENA